VCLAGAAGAGAGVVDAAVEGVAAGAGVVDAAAGVEDDDAGDAALARASRFPRAIAEMRLVWSRSFCAAPMPSSLPRFFAMASSL